MNVQLHRCGVKGRRGDTGSRSIRTAAAAAPGAPGAAGAAAAAPSGGHRLALQERRDEPHFLRQPTLLAQVTNSRTERETD